MISIGILTKNAGPEFAKLLKAIDDQEIESSTELVILDSGSTDDTRKLARDSGARVFDILPEAFSFGSARDQLFNYCQGEIIVTVSQDVVPEDNSWLTKLITPLVDGTAEISQGRELAADDAFFWVKNGCFYFTGAWAHFTESNGGVGLSCVNLAIRRKTWELLKFSPIPICEDKLLQKRAAESGIAVAICEDAIVIHRQRFNLTDVTRRCLNEGMALRLLEQRYTLSSLIRGLRQIGLYKLVFKEFTKKRSLSFAEMIYPLLRPVALYFGGLFVEDLLKPRFQ